jgi:alanine racemase
VDPTRRAWVEVDLGAIQANVAQIRRHIGSQCHLMAVVKADAYGHGALAVSRAALEAGAHCLGVATLEEGIQLRQEGVQATIILLGAINTPEEAQAVQGWKIEPTLCTPKQVLTFAEAITRPLSVHLKIDTGMGRLGTHWQEALSFVRLAYSQPNLQVASVYSHLATADEPDSPVVHEQHQRFQSVLKSLQEEGLTPPSVHLANSAATLAYPALHYDMVRVGLSIYGLSPSAHLGNILNLQPAMQVRARIVQVKTLPAGSGVSYGHRYHTQKPTRIATVAIGYADGIPRTLSDKLVGLVRGQCAPQIGTVTMDQLMIDVSGLGDIQEGEIVTFLGCDGEQCISASDWADQIGTISYEILCGFKHRLPRVVRQFSTVS